MINLNLKYNNDDKKGTKQLEINRIGKEKNGFQQTGLINHVLAKRFINPGGPPVFKLHFFFGRRRLINNGVLINPDLTLISYKNSGTPCCPF